MSDWWLPSKPENLQPIPWLSPDATAKLAGLVQPGWRVLEHGSGGSTLWLAARVEHVTAVEDDPDWYQAVSRQMPANVKLMSWSKTTVPPRLGRFDLLLIDGSVPARAAWIKAALRLVKPGGIIVLDNYNRPEYETERLALQAQCDHTEVHYKVGLYLNTQFLFTYPESGRHA